VGGGEIGGATVDQAMLALSELGHLHGPLLGDTTTAYADWLNRESPVSDAIIGKLYAGFAERYGDQIAPEHRDVCERLVGCRRGVFPRMCAVRRHPLHALRRAPAGLP